MKCLNCGVHYDDSESECPICGTKSGRGKHANVPRYTSYTHDTHSEQDCTHRSFTSAAGQKKPQRSAVSAPLGGNKNKKEETKAGKAVATVVAVIIVLAQILPSCARTILDNGAAFLEENNWSVSAPEPDVPMPDNGYTDDSFAEADYVYAADLLGSELGVELADGTLSLSIDEYDNYTLRRAGADWDYSESGWLYCELLDSTYDVYNETHSADQYDAYYMEFAPSESESTSGAPELMTDSRWLVLYIDRATGDVSFWDYDGQCAALFGGAQEVAIWQVQNG